MVQWSCSPATTQAEQTSSSTVEAHSAEKPRTLVSTKTAPSPSPAARNEPVEIDQKQQQQEQREQRQHHRRTRSLALAGLSLRRFGSGFAQFRLRLQEHAAFEDSALFPYFAALAASGSAPTTISPSTAAGLGMLEAQHADFEHLEVLDRDIG